MAIWNARNKTEKHIFECDYSFLNFAIEILLKLWLHMFKNGFFLLLFGCDKYISPDKPKWFPIKWNPENE